MAENVEGLRGAYEALGRGDMEAVTATWETDIEFDGPNSSRMPGAGPHRGKEEVARLFSGMKDRWEGLLFSPDEFVEQGETVVVLGHMEGRAKATGTDVKVPFVHVWRMREGKVARGQALTDTAVVADALGR
jgi:ketosteroid isomerase-like protein